MLKEGDYVAGYQVVQQLGKGGMARVYRARRVGIGDARKAVALKVMLEHVSGDPRYREMFLREAKIAMMLNSPSVVQVFEAAEDEKTGQLFMAMEWVQGHNLSIIRSMLEQRGEHMPLEVSAYIIGEVLAALDYAHNVYAEGHPTGLIHRDVTPQNVMIGHDGSVKLADFGVARTAHDESSMAAKGKLRYMAKEHLMGKATQRSDLFGVGAIFHELLSGKRFRSEATDEAQLYHAIMGGDAWRDALFIPQAQAPGRFRPLPTTLARLLDGLLAPDEKRRLPSASAALEVLESWEGYRPGRRALARLYGEVFGEAATRTVTGGTSFHRVDLDDPKIQQQRAVVQAQMAAAAARTEALPGQHQTPRATATVVLDPPHSAAAAPTRTAAVARATVPTPAAHSTAHPLEVAKLPNRRAWLWVGLSMLVIVSAVVTGTLLATLDREGEIERVALPEPTEGQAKHETVTVDTEPASVADPAPSGPIIPAAMPAEPHDPTSAASETPEPQPETAPVDTRDAHEVSAPAKPATTKSTTPRSSPTPAPSPVVDAPPRTVHIRLSELRAAYVMIGKKEHVVEPRHTLRLKPGRHRMTWRTTKSEAWRPARTFTIGAEEDEWVVLVRPSGIEVLTLKKHLGKH